MNPRRQFLRFLASSPLFAEAWAQQQQQPNPASAADVLAVMDFEELAHRALPPAHWGYMTSGVDDNATRDANMAGYKRIQLRPRRLIDVSKVDLRINLFGTEWESPIFLCPLGGQKMFNPDGEVATARAAKSKHALQILSTQTSASVEEVAQALGRPPWYQLYMPTKWEDTEKLVHRVEEAGCPAMAWTIDLLGGRNTETATRLARTDTRNCLSCHVAGPNGNGLDRTPSHRPMFTGLSGTAINPSSATWEHVDRLKKLTRMKLLLKGLDTAEDAASQAAAALEVARRQNDLTKAGAWSYDIANQQKVYDALVQAHNAAAALLVKFVLMAPVDGVVLTVNGTVGGYVSSPGVFDTYTQGLDPVVVMGTPQQFLAVRCFVDEILVSKLPTAFHIQAQMTVLGSDAKVPLEFVRVEPYVSPKIELSNQRQEQVDLRVLPVIFRFPKQDAPVYPGQMVDVYIGSK